jgi:hypothetical protein
MTQDAAYGKAPLQEKPVFRYGALMWNEGGFGGPERIDTLVFNLKASLPKAIFAGIIAASDHKGILTIYVREESTDHAKLLEVAKIIWRILDKGGECVELDDETTLNARLAGAFQ